MMQNTEAAWKGLLNDKRRKPKKGNDQDTRETRTEIERDYDRILFSTPVRRLADKTQVFPLDKNDSVRTRLTHSHEVSNLARSIGTALVFVKGKKGNQIACGVKQSQRNIPALLAAIGLAHDLGNPPFGHQGEFAIRAWFRKNENAALPVVQAHLNTKEYKKYEQYKQDFLQFEGNAQAFRLVTRLQIISDDFGLDLTYATLAALLKYPTKSNCVNKEKASLKKHGFFAAEQHIVEEVRKKTGLSEGQRHALTYIMEACDDIAYSVLDAEDTIKKGLASFCDLMDHMLTNSRGNDFIKKIIDISFKKYREYQKIDLSAVELNDISMQRFRVFAIHEMILESIAAFRKHETAILENKFNASLLSEESDAGKLCEALKNFSNTRAYQHYSVLEAELAGYNAIIGLMDFFWVAIKDRERPEDPKSRRCSPFTRYVYKKISENYRRIFENPTKKDKKLPLWYRECLLLTDMISGMTDSFAIELYRDLSKIKGDFNVHNFLSTTFRK